MPSSEVWDDEYPPDARRALTFPRSVDPASSAPCTKSDVRKCGGHLRVTLPAGADLRNTQIVIESIGKNPLSYQQLITVAKSLTPVG